MKRSIKRFKAKLGSDEGSLFIEVPFDAKVVFGKARPPVKVTVNRHQYRSTIAVYNDRSYLPVRKSNREAAGVEIGDVVDVIIELDDEPRVVLMPAEAITGAKKPETRARRVKKTLKMLREK